ncbi:MAG: STM3941 family protein [Pseudomonadota bacterium]
MTAVEVDRTSAPQADLPYTVPVKTSFLRTIANVSLGLAALCLAILLLGEDNTGEDFLFGTLGVLLFGVGGFYLRKSVPTFKTAFDATDDGLTVHSQYGSVGPIPWAEIREFKLEKTKVKFVSLKAIGVVLQNPEKTLAGTSLNSRFQRLASEYTDYSAISVPTMLIDGATFEVLDKLNAILKAKKGG